MAKYLYLRVSTSKQSFEQQIQEIKNYGIDPDRVDGIVEEKESGGKSYTDRKFRQLLIQCKGGDFIYVASTDRLGRNFVDMIRLMEDAKKRGITIIACKQGLSLSDDNMATKILLSVTAIIDEDERMRTKHRTKNFVASATNEINEKGFRITKRGKVQTHWGREKGCDMSEAVEASARARTDRSILWKESSIAVKTARRMKAEGWTLLQIVSELHKLYDDNKPSDPTRPNPYAGMKGGKPPKGTVSKWLRESNSLTLC